MLVDVVKYLLTVIVIGNIFAKDFSIKITLVGMLLVIFIGIIAFFVIPNDKTNDKEAK